MKLRTPPEGIDKSEHNLSDLGAGADWIDAMLRRRGYEPLTTDARDTLWQDYADEAAALCLADAEAIALAREHVSGILGVQEAN